MDSFFKRAQEFANTAAEKSKQLAAESYQLTKETAKKSQLLASESIKKASETASVLSKKASETASESFKKAGVTASEFSKKATETAKKTAEQAESRFKSLAQELNPNNVNQESRRPKQEELEEFGITEELIDFIKGINIKTYREFPIEEIEGAASPSGAEGSRSAEDAPVGQEPTTTGSSDLSGFQEHHARLVLCTVQEVSDFRYVLCPRRMKESKFWKIYFTLVQSHIALYEARWKEKQSAAPSAAAKSQDSVPTSSGQNIKASDAEVDEKQTSPGVAASAAGSAAPGVAGKPPEGAEVQKSKDLPGDHDLDAYLMGALSTHSDGESDDAFDPDDFEKLVNSTGAIDSDRDEDANSPSKKSTFGKGGVESGVGAADTAASGSPTSDGVFVEADQEQEPQKQPQS